MSEFLIKVLMAFFFATLFCIDPKAQNNYHIIFYNVENLFDTWDDPITNDDQFTAQGDYHWTTNRFNKKIQMIFKTLISSCEGNFPDIIGLAEVENRWVLEQLLTKTPLNKIPYIIVHKDSPDPRGIDVALLVRKDRIQPVDIEFIEVSSKGKLSFVSRDILHFTAVIEGEKIHFFVNHWPSRSDGYIVSREKRNIAAKILHTSLDSLLVKDKNAKVIVMGDFNSSPKEESLFSILDAKSMKERKFLINLSYEWKDGTIFGRGVWETFDQFICSSNLLDGRIKIMPSHTKICLFSFLLEKDRNYLINKPFRTYLGPIYHGGISDHLPVVSVLSCEY